MSNFEQGSFSLGTVTTTTVNLNGSFTPAFIELEIGPRTGTNETLVTRSSGWHDFNLSRRACISIFDDGVVHTTRESTSSDITHYKNVSSVATKIIDGTLSNPQAGSFDYTSTAADSNYTIRFKAFA